MSNALSAAFKAEDIVVCKEDIYSVIYDRVFPKGHEFEVVGVLPLGLTIEDGDGYRLNSMGFLRFEVIDPRGDYRKNHSGGWYVR